MPRQPRLKIEDAEGSYHAWNAIACKRGEYPLAAPYVRHKFLAPFSSIWVFTDGLVLGSKLYVLDHSLHALSTATTALE